MFPRAEWSAEDTEILDRALNEQRIRITLDHDISFALGHHWAWFAFVVLPHVQNVDASGQADLIRAVYTHCADALSKGAAVSVDRNSIRVRRLPLR